MPAFIVRACAPCVSRLSVFLPVTFLVRYRDIVMLDETPLRPVTRVSGGGAYTSRLIVDTAITVRMTVPLCSTDGLVYPDRAGSPDPPEPSFETGVR